jgi:hypothetical protein
MIRVRVAGSCDAPAGRSGAGASHAARCFSLFERQLRVQSNRLLLPVGAKNIASISFLRVVVRFPRSKRAEFDTTSPIFIACPQTLCTFGEVMVIPELGATFLQQIY